MAIETADGNKSKPKIFTLLRLSADIGSRVYESYFTTSIRRSTLSQMYRVQRAATASSAGRTFGLPVTTPIQMPI